MGNDTNNSHGEPRNNVKMGHPAGLRAGTRYAFSRDFRKKGMIKLSTYLRQYKVGDIVDIKANGAVQKGKHRYIEKRVNLRVEHISLSRSREEFVRRVKQNAELKKKSKTDGTHVHLKRQPLMPREARTISMKDNVPETVVPIAYETTI